MSDWRHRALCAPHDAVLWFPSARDWDAIREAKRICQRCPVQAECLRWALEKGWDVGIFGGLLPSERRRLEGES